MDSRYDKLPRWAQNDFVRLARQLAEAQDALAVLEGGIEGESKVAFRIGIDSLHPLPKYASLHFRLKNGADLHVFYDAAGMLNVNVTSGGRLYVLPGAANSVILDSER